MERNIEINGHAHLIKGKWVVDGISLIFKGDAIDSRMNKEVLTIEHSFPFSFQRKYGTAVIEDEIVASVKEYLEQKA